MSIRICKYFWPIRKAETFFTSSLKLLNGILGNFTGSRISTSYRFVFSGQSENQNGRPGLWLAETAERNSTKLQLTESKISMSSSMFVLFELIGKPRWPPWPIRQQRCTQGHDMWPFGPLVRNGHYSPLKQYTKWDFDQNSNVTMT